MYSYEAECQVTNALFSPFDSKERMKIYFETPLEVLRVHIEDTFTEDYDPDCPTGVFPDCLIKIEKATEQMDNALKKWSEDNNPEPVENILNNIEKAVDFYCNARAKMA